MDKKTEMEALDRIIKDGEIRLRTVSVNIETLTKDIEQLAIIEGDLIDNIKFLKKNKIIAIADDYKKAKDDLAKTVIKMIALKNDREVLRKDAQRTQTAMAEAQLRLKELRKDKNNVLKGKFGKGNGQG